MNITCYLCSSIQNKVVFNENGIEILKCNQCGHVFSSFEQKEHYDGYWESENYDLKWWDEAHREIYQDFIKKFIKKESGTLLDVGCGLGFFVKSVMDSKPNWNVIGFEISENAVSFGKRVNGLKNIHSGIVQNSKIEKNSLDIITLWDVIEHIPKPHSLLEYLYSLLKPNGILFIQTPNFPIQLFKAKLKVFVHGMRPEIHYLEAKDHINNYYKSTLIRLGNQIGFRSAKNYILKPIMSVAGQNGKIVFFKKGYYFISKILSLISFNLININNTLFVTLKK